MLRMSSGYFVVVLVWCLTLVHQAGAEKIRTSVPGLNLNYLSIFSADARGFFRDEGLENETIVVEIADGQPAREVERLEGGAGSAGDIREPAGGASDEQLQRHLPGEEGAAVEDVRVGRQPGEEAVVPYDMIHVTPPMSPPEFVRTGPLASADGWIEVDKFSLQHVRFPEVFSLGDASNLPTSWADGIGPPGTGRRT